MGQNQWCHIWVVIHIHLPSISMFTRCQGFDPLPNPFTGPKVPTLHSWWSSWCNVPPVQARQRTGSERIQVGSRVSSWRTSVSYGPGWIIWTVQIHIELLNRFTDWTSAGKVVFFCQTTLQEMAFHKNIAPKRLSQRWNHKRRRPASRLGMEMGNGDSMENYLWNITDDLYNVGI